MKPYVVVLALLFGVCGTPASTGGVESGDGDATVKTAAAIKHGRDAEGWTYLAYVKPLSWYVGYGTLWQFKRGGERLSIAGTGKSFDTGLVAHAVSSVKYKLSGKCKQFHSYYGLRFGSVARFVVLCDGKETFRSRRVWTSGGTQWYGVKTPINLDVTGVNILELRTYGDDNGQVAASFGAWANPKVR